MNGDDQFQKLKEFLESKPASHRALKSLKKGVEIGIRLADSIDLTLFCNESDKPQLEKRAAVKPDVVFHLQPEAVDIICQNPGNDVGELGITIVREVISGTVKIKVPGKILNILRNGYLEIIKLGGRTFFDFLAQNGLKTLSKLPGIIKKMKSH